MMNTRLQEICYTVWQLLTEDERETYYYNTGLIGFIEDDASLIGFDVNKLNETDLNLIMLLLK